MANILLIDDNESLRTAYTSFLTRMGHTITAVSSVPEALTYLATNTPDLLLIDMLLPKVNGLELLQQYDIVHTHTSVKAIAFSSLTEPLLEAKAVDLGVALYINKSHTTPQDLLDGIAGVLSK